MQFEFSFDQVAEDSLNFLRGKFKLTATEYPTVFKSYYNEIWEYKDVKIINHKKPWGSWKEILKRGVRVDMITEPLVMSNQEFAKILIQYV